MKFKSIILCIICAFATVMPMQAQTKAPAAQVSSSTAAFGKMKNDVTTNIAKMKAAASAEEVTNVMYNYTKLFLQSTKNYNAFSDYQKKQIDVLVNQFGTQAQAKIAKYGCKKQCDAAVQRATLESLSALK